MAHLSEQSTIKAKAGLRAGARSRGIKPGSRRHGQYVYGGLRKIGWKPSKEVAATALKMYRKKK